MAKLEVIKIGNRTDHTENGIHRNGHSPLPSSVDLELCNNTPKGTLRVMELYDLLSQNGGLSHQDQIAFLHPGLPKGQANLDRAWNTTLFSREELARQLEERGNPVVLKEVEDEAGTLKFVLSKNDNINPLEHPENIGKDGTANRILADILFPKGLQKRAVFRRDLLDTFTKAYLESHPEASRTQAVTAFDNALNKVGEIIEEWDIPHQIARTGQGRQNTFYIIRPIKIEETKSEVKVSTPPPPTPEPKIIPEAELKTKAEKAEREKILHEAETIFGVSKTRLLYALSNGKAASVLELTQARRGKHGQVTSQEISTTRTILSALKHDLPQGIEIQNPIGEDGKVNPDRFFLYPLGITLESILEAKKEEAGRALETPQLKTPQIADIEPELAELEIIKPEPAVEIEDVIESLEPEAQEVITDEVVLEVGVESPIVIQPEEEINLEAVFGGKNVVDLFERLIGSDNDNAVRIQDAALLLHPEKKRIKGTIIADAQRKILELNKGLLRGTLVEIKYVEIEGLKNTFYVWLSLPENQTITTIEELGAYIQNFERPVEAEVAVSLSEEPEAEPIDPELQEALNTLPTLTGKLSSKRKKKRHQESERPIDTDSPILYRKELEKKKFEPVVLSSDPRNMDIVVKGREIHLPFGQQRALLESLRHMVGSELSGEQLAPEGSEMSQEVAITNFIRLKEMFDKIPGMEGAFEVFGSGRYRRFRINTQIIIV